MKHHVIYVPGLGDRSVKNRYKLFTFWRYPGVTTEIYQVDWQHGHHWQEKLSGLLHRIDTAQKQGKTVSLIGESAGASAVMNALKHRADDVHRIILLCGKSQFPDRISPYLKRKNPTLQTAVHNSHSFIQELDHSIKQKILNLHPIADPIVPVWETKIQGVKNARIPSVGHASSIIFGMLVWHFRIITFIKKGK